MPEPDRAVPASASFEALGDPTRRAILELLSDSERSVQQLADELPVSRPAVSRHLRQLERAGLVAERRDGTRHYYRLEEAGVLAAQEYFRRLWGESTVRFRLFAENTEQD
jgi:DNA-binding transcriptional ArsR family regulator